jgi:hypothetical protein
VTAGPAPESPGHNRPDHPVPVMNGVGRTGHARVTRPERVEADTLPGIVTEAADMALGCFESAGGTPALQPQ